MLSRSFFLAAYSSWRLSKRTNLTMQVRARFLSGLPRRCVVSMSAAERVTPSFDPSWITLAARSSFGVSGKPEMLMQFFLEYCSSSLYFSRCSMSSSSRWRICSSLAWTASATARSTIGLKMSPKAEIVAGSLRLCRNRSLNWSGFIFSTLCPLALTAHSGPSLCRSAGRAGNARAAQ